MSLTAIRPDLVAAQAEAWRRVTMPGASLTGAERAAIAQLALAALDDPEPLAPWVLPSQAGREIPVCAAVLSADVRDAVYRIARHAATLTEGWYDTLIASGIDPFAYVEMVGVIAAVVAVDGFFRASGLERPPLPNTVDGAPHGQHPQVEPATLNWVPVAVPADAVAAVVQGLSASPEEMDTVRLLAAAQYIPFDSMGELGWSRGTLSRGEMELVAARLSRARECFY